MIKKINIDEVDVASQDLKDLVLQFTWFDANLSGYSDTVSGVCTMLEYCVKDNEDGYSTYVSVIDNKEYDFQTSEVNRLIGVSHMQKYLAAYEIADYYKQLCDCDIASSVRVNYNSVVTHYDIVNTDDLLNLEHILSYSDEYTISINNCGELRAEIQVCRLSGAFYVEIEAFNKGLLLAETCEYSTCGLNDLKAQIYNLLTP